MNNDKRRLLYPGLGLLALAAGILLAFNASAANGRAVTGYELTYLLNGSPKYLGTIADAAPGTFTSNSTTAAPFTVGDGEFLMLQCDVAVYVTNLAHNHSNATTAKSVKISADEKYLLGLVSKGVPLVSVDSVTGAASCKVFGLY